ncbi:acyl-CoA dehydrogenase family protein [Xanthomonas sp. NCPPB 2654]|uniref:acyl-CoA dehydrogenase family protein n=1 Tax=unclassified Xanthomonas TaxID=2643310 RepID=UPI0021E070FF|nr:MULTISPECIES: acyl-CoA dehydrogenase family protein [unclassified Xanthomonas]MDL5365137.1 acyl-CoA dehydrogenase family protein [Xanthomonas sp. NCPPB 2654]UYC21560.1 acyl-CoA dehydrogenase family protein [Xanthomonas sp. CFBP 8443]
MIERAVFREDHALFREQVRRFIDAQIAPHYAQWERDGITPRSLWRAAGAAGLLNCQLPEPYGLGGDYGHAACVIEELARANFLGIGFSIHSDMAAPYLMQYGSDAVRDAWLPKMARGEAIGAIAMTEPGAGSDLKAIRTRAERHGDHYLLNGQKTWITNGSNADVAVVVATVAPELGARGLTLFCVDTALPGISRGAPMAKIGQHAQDTSELFFQDVAVPVSHLLGEEQRGFDYLGEQLAAERLAIALRAAASAEGMLAETIAYVRQRKAFGRHLIDHQNTRFVLADAAARLAMLRSFLDQCLDAQLQGRLQATTAAMAKLNATEIQGQVLDALLQLHGGYGYSSEYGIGRAWADARALRIFGGTSEILRDIIGRAL